MKIYCLEDFKEAYEKLISKKSYLTLEQAIISYFFGKSVQELAFGTRLNNNDKAPYIKKRLKVSGDFDFIFCSFFKMKVYI